MAVFHIPSTPTPPPLKLYHVFCPPPSCHQTDVFSHAYFSNLRLTPRFSKSSSFLFFFFFSSRVWQCLPGSVQTVKDKYTADWEPRQPHEMRRRSAVWVSVANVEDGNTLISRPRRLHFMSNIKKPEHKGVTARVIPRGTLSYFVIL